jgi:hypothetical protein
MFTTFLPPDYPSSVVEFSALGPGVPVAAPYSGPEPGPSSIGVIKSQPPPREAETAPHREFEKRTNLCQHFFFRQRKSQYPAPCMRVCVRSNVQPGRMRASAGKSTPQVIKAPISGSPIRRK